MRDITKALNSPSGSIQVGDTLHELGNCVRAIGGREEEAQRYFKLASQQVDRGILNPSARWINGPDGTQQWRGEIGYPTEDEQPYANPPSSHNADGTTSELPMVSRLSGSTE